MYKILERNKIHRFDGTCHIFADVDRALGQLVQGCRNLHADGPVQLQAGDHTLPGAVAAHITQVMALQMVTGVHHITDGAEVKAKEKTSKTNVGGLL